MNSSQKINCAQQLHDYREILEIGIETSRKFFIKLLQIEGVIHFLPKNKLTEKSVSFSEIVGDAWDDEMDVAFFKLWSATKRNPLKSQERLNDLVGIIDRHINNAAEISATEEHIA